MLEEYANKMLTRKAQTAYTPKMRGKLLVRWLMKTAIQIDGVNRTRCAGDEDLLPEHEARAFVQCGMAKMVGEA